MRPDSLYRHSTFASSHMPAGETLTDRFCIAVLRTKIFKHYCENNDEKTYPIFYRNIGHRVIGSGPDERESIGDGRLLI